ncbi:MAG: M28 family metallopeptidase [Gaiellaceae bacterium]
MRLKSPRRRPRSGSLEHPVSVHLYRRMWLAALVPLLLLPPSLDRPGSLPSPTSQPAFDAASAYQQALGFARAYPDRSPGSVGSAAARAWLVDQLRTMGFEPSVDVFRARIPGRGQVSLANVSVRIKGGSSSTLVVVAHRDNAGLSAGGGANDNASGTAALLELARDYAKPPGPTPAHVPNHTLLFLSSDGGSFGGIGAAHFASRFPARKRIAAVVNLDSIAGAGLPRVLITGDAPQSPLALLVGTARDRLRDQLGSPPGRTSALRQLIDLAFPFSAYEQAPFVGHGIPAVTLTTGGDRPGNAATDTPANLDQRHLTQVGTATGQLIESLDQGMPEPQASSASYLYLGGRVIRGWVIQLLLLACLLPPLTAVVDLYARCRRRRIRLLPALRSYLRRLAFWLFLAGLFLFFALVGLWPNGISRPPALDTAAARNWPLPPLILLGTTALVAWFVSRSRLLPRRGLQPEEELAGYVVAFLALMLLALLVVLGNRYTLIFLLLPLHLWIWLPQARREDRVPLARFGLLAAGLLGPGLLVWSFAERFGLGLTAIWYIGELIAVGYTSVWFLLGSAIFAATFSQLAALSGGRYAPYPEPHERPPYSLFQRSGRLLLLVAGAGRARARRAALR